MAAELIRKKYLDKLKEGIENTMGAGVSPEYRVQAYGFCCKIADALYFAQKNIERACLPLPNEPPNRHDIEWQSVIIEENIQKEGDQYQQLALELEAMKAKVEAYRFKLNERLALSRSQLVLPRT